MADGKMARWQIWNFEMLRMGDRNGTQGTNGANEMATSRATRIKDEDEQSGDFKRAR